MNLSLESVPSAADIDGCLPQTQCTRCGYPTCMDYATALERGETQINRCPPGGQPTLTALAKCLGQPPVSTLAADCEPYAGRQIARIVESQCIGCTLCLDPCPTDAILGASKQMHTVLIEDCTGCELCIQVCPVDCIEMVDSNFDRSGPIWPQFSDAEIARFRQLAIRHQTRVAKNRDQTSQDVESDEIKQQIRTAVNRERTRRWRNARRTARKSTAPGAVK